MRSHFMVTNFAGRWRSPIATSSVDAGLRGCFGGSSVLGTHALEKLRHLEPVVHAYESGGKQIMRRGVEQALAFEAQQVARLVVDEKVGAEDRLVAAKDVMRGRDEGKVALQPAVFRAERIGHGHGLRGDEDFKARGQFLQHRLRAGHQGQVFEKIFGIEKSAQLLPGDRSA